MRNFAMAALLLAAPLMAQSIDGRWNATVQVGKVTVPFRLEFTGDGAAVKGSLFNGEERFTSTSGRLADGSLTLAWDYMADRLEAKLENGALSGTFYRPKGVAYVFHAERATSIPEAVKAPSIDGLWTIEGVHSEKGESAWQLIVRQSGAEVSAAILRIDGDTGTLTGRYQDGKFVLSHFSGMRPALVEITPDGAGLKVSLNHHAAMAAVRPAVAKAEGLAQPDDPTKHTGVKDASQPFRFDFPDLNGKMVSESDPRFKGKVVLVNIFGSWCPNCHDEAPFLEETYKKFRAEGLEIVALSFEEPDQLKNPVRLRAFLKRYGIDYTVLLAGDTDSAAEKLSQASHWDAWPTTFLLGRDGRVRAVHTGFPSKASGELFVQAKQEFTEQVEKLLAENALTLR